jgi:hypothetical protein
MRSEQQGEGFCRVESTQHDFEGVTCDVRVLGDVAGIEFGWVGSSIGF